MLYLTVKVQAVLLALPQLRGNGPIFTSLVPGLWQVCKKKQIIGPDPKKDVREMHSVRYINSKSYKYFYLLVDPIIYLHIINIWVVPDIRHFLLSGIKINHMNQI